MTVKYKCLYPVTCLLFSSLHQDTNLFLHFRRGANRLHRSCQACPPWPVLSGGTSLPEHAQHRFMISRIKCSACTTSGNCLLRIRSKHIQRRPRDGSQPAQRARWGCLAVFSLLSRDTMFLGVEGKRVLVLDISVCFQSLLFSFLFSLLLLILLLCCLSLLSIH